jgi:hypothetical protein
VMSLAYTHSLRSVIDVALPQQATHFVKFEEFKGDNKYF